MHVQMIEKRLRQSFGEHEAFNLEAAARLKNLMLQELRDGKQLEYNSDYGLAHVFVRSNGHLCGGDAGDERDERGGLAKLLQVHEKADWYPVVPLLLWLDIVCRGGCCYWGG